MTDSEIQTINLGDVIFKYFDYYGQPYFNAHDVFNFVENGSYAHKVKKTLRAGIDYVQMRIKQQMPYFITPDGIVKLIEGMTSKNVAHVTDLYKFFQEKYGTQCKIPESSGRYCPVCGAEIPITAPKHQIYCSKKCKKDDENRKARERAQAARNATNNPTKICPQCGKSFVNANNRKKFCSKACCDKYWQKQRLHGTFYFEERTCPICKKKFTPVTPAQVVCSTPCRNVYRLLKKEHKTFCKYCFGIFTPKKKKQEFCCRECEVAYYKKRNFWNLKEIYPEEYKYFVEDILPETPDFLMDWPNALELSKPDYQRKNCIAVSFEPYPV